MGNREYIIKGCRLDGALPAKHYTAGVGMLARGCALLLRRQTQDSFRPNLIEVLTNWSEKLGFVPECEELKQLAWRIDLGEQFVAEVNSVNRFTHGRSLRMTFDVYQEKTDPPQKT